MSGPQNPVAAGTAAQNDVNTLKSIVLRLPLGHSAKDPDTNHEKTYFWFVIPTNTGGRLMLVHQGKGGTLTLLGNDAKTVILKAGGVIDIPIPAGTFGNFWVVAEGGDVREVSSRFVQTGVARESASPGAAPLIPWNFHFWPSVRNSPDGSPNPEIPLIDNMIRRYAHAFGKDEKAAVLWEKTNHQTDTGPGWSGHCHLMAGASILFKQPVPRTVNVRGSATAQVAFTEEELEFFAGEWFGNFGGKVVVFTMENRGVEPWNKLLPDKFYTMLLKPSETHLNASELATRLEKAILSYQPSLADKAKIMAQNATARGNLGDIVAEAFGQAAVDFYRTLIKKILVEGHALEGDLRGSGPDNRAAEVWNHAIFYYEANYKEILPMHVSNPVNNTYMEIDLLLVANADYPSPPSPGSPATVTQGLVDVNQTQWPNRKVRMTLDIAFDLKTGEMLDKDKRNKWTSCRNDGIGGAAEIYAPSYLAEIVPVGTTQATAEPNQDADPRVVGNVAVDLELMAEAPPLLTVRDRYKKK